MTEGVFKSNRGPGWARRAAWLPFPVVGWLDRASRRLGALYRRLALTVERRGGGFSLERAYRESEERYNALVELLPDAVLVHSRGRCRFANRACLKLLGVSLPGALVGRDFLDLVHPDDRARMASRLDPVNPDAESCDRRAEFRLLRFIGGPAVVEMTAGFVRYEGRPSELLILRDISDRQAREADLRRLNRALKAVSVSDSAMMRAHREEDYLQEVCRIVESCGYRTVWIGYAPEDASPGLRPVAWAGLEQADLERLQEAWRAGVSVNAVEQCLHRKRPVLSRDSVPDFALAATLALPLLNAGKPWGALVIHAPEADAFSDEEVSLLEELANDLAYGVGAIRLRESLARSSQALRQSEERYRRLIEVLPDGILVNRDNRIVFVNDALLALTGAGRADAIIGRNPYDLFDPSYHDLMKSRIAQLMEGASGPRVEGKLRRLDGIVVDVDVAAIPYQSPDGPSILVALRDITSRKRYEQALRRSTQELTRSNQDLEQFAHVASHDLKEPLRMVTGFLSLLRESGKDRLEPKALEHIRFAIEAATRMQRLIEDLLSYSRVGRGGDVKRVRASEAMDQALKNLKIGIEESGSLITCGNLPDVRANFLELTQLFQNLLGNAIKFRGGRRPEISVDARREGDYWRFQVRDNGIGLDPCYAERIFQIFNRLHTAEEYAGTGIGLAICKKVVERYGGRIWVESRPGEGATFFFTLPSDSVQLLERTG